MCHDCRERWEGEKRQLFILNVFPGSETRHCKTWSTWRAWPASARTTTSSKKSCRKTVSLQTHDTLGSRSRTRTMSSTSSFLLCCLLSPPSLPQHHQCARAAQTAEPEREREEKQERGDFVAGGGGRLRFSCPHTQPQHFKSSVFLL